MTDVLDIRDLADEWNAALVAAAEGDPSYGEMVDIEGKYVDLCEELGIGKLGIDPSPDALRDYGHSYEPTLIAAGYFTEYAQELAAEDDERFGSGGGAQVFSAWPYRYIDWDAAADELRQDYTRVTFDGTDYYIRSV